MSGKNPVNLLKGFCCFFIINLFFCGYDIVLDSQCQKSTIANVSLNLADCVRKNKKQFHRRSHAEADRFLTTGQLQVYDL